MSTKGTRRGFGLVESRVVGGKDVHQGASRWWTVVVQAGYPPSSWISPGEIGTSRGVLGRCLFAVGMIIAVSLCMNLIAPVFPMLCWGPSQRVAVGDESWRNW